MLTLPLDRLQLFTLIVGTGPLVKHGPIGIMNLIVVASLHMLREIEHWDCGGHGVVYVTESSDSSLSHALSRSGVTVRESRLERIYNHIFRKERDLADSPVNHHSFRC
eukprot:5046041-Amphidinium_carterae.2